MTTPVVGATSQRRLTPYLTVDMFKTHARRGVPVNNLVPGGNAQDQDQALAEYIDEASSELDSFCQQILAATIDTDVRRVNVNRNGFVNVHPRYRPLIALVAFSIGATPAQMAPLASLTGSIVDTQMFSVPAYAGVLPVNTNQGPIQLGSPSALPGQSWVQYNYCNGFPVTQLTADVAAGATSVSVLDTTGIIAGATRLTVYSGKTRVRFLAGTVSTAPTGGVGTGPGTVVCPAMPQAITVVNQPIPVMIAALPPDVISGAVLLTRALIKDSGAGNITSPTIAPNASQAGDNGADADRDKAYKILRPYVAPVE